jgi:NDP-sugar pyrophosphorylase family protein
MNGLVDGIILAGTYQWSGASFENLLPRPLLPVAQAPLISYSLRWMAEGGVARLFICLNEATRRVRDYIGDGAHLGVSVEYYEDASPRGAAGCARDVASRSDARTFLVSDGTVVPTVDRDHLLASHYESGAALTVVVHRDDHAESQTAPLSPAGIYVADRSVFDYVAPSGFQDIKESLIPRLHRVGLRVRTHLAEGCCPRVVDAGSYLTVSHWMICRLVYEHGTGDGWSPVYSGAGEVLAHPTAWVDPGAKLLGPVLLGPGIRVKDGAAIVGPASVGAESTIGEGAVVSRSVTWERCVVNEGAFLDACVLADDAQVDAGADLCGAVVMAAAARSRPDRWAARSKESLPPLLPWTLRQPATPDGDPT